MASAGEIQVRKKKIKKSIREIMVEVKNLVSLDFCFLQLVYPNRLLINNYKYHEGAVIMKKEITLQCIQKYRLFSRLSASTV